MKNLVNKVIFFVFCFFAISQVLVSAELATFSPKFKFQGDLTMLDVTGFQQTTDFTCGPCSILTLMNYFSLKGNEMNIAGEVRAVPGSGSHPVEMTKWLNTNGFEANWGEALNEKTGLKMLQDNLKNGIPTLVEWIDWGGHWVVVVGYDTKGTENQSDDEIIFADPYDHTDGKADGLTFVNTEKFLAMWFDAQCFDRPMKRLYINAFPKKR